MAKITIVFGTQPQGEVNLDKPSMKVGRAMDCDIVIDNLGISRHHCTIVKEGEGFTLVDGGSNNGTYVGGQKIDRHPLKNGDRIVLGKHHLVFDAIGYAATSASQGKKAQAMGGEMTMFVDQAALAKAMSDGGGRLSLVLIQGGREVPVQLLKDETTIGTAADIPVKGFLVKAVQARVIRANAAYRLVSSGGWRAVRLNGAKIAGEAALKAGDKIAIAGTTITVR